MKIPCSDSKITSAVWGPLGEFIIAGHESGELNQFSAKVSVTRRSPQAASLGRGYYSIPVVIKGQNVGFWTQTSGLVEGQLKYVALLSKAKHTHAYLSADSNI